MNQGFLGALDRALDRLQLLGNLEARPVIFDHFDDGLKMTISALETPDNRGVVLVGHVLSYPPMRIEERILSYPPMGIIYIPHGG